MGKAKTRIVKCTLDQLEELVEIGLQTFTDTFGHLNDPVYFEPYVKRAFNKAQITRELQNAGSTFHFIYHEESLAGYLKLNCPPDQSDLNDPDSLEIERIYILDQFQGLGLGRALFALALNTAKDAGHKFIWLGVWEKNEVAIRFYKQQGFYQFARHPFKLGDDLQTDHLMRLDL